ncbi:ABC transporter permease [Sedimentimonas flavescens]|uniref:ABC transporter permease n=1 Tax=Sedimentimonas flavescens TaxID=2851012 RepID=UPI001C4A0FC1|nr:ABC transporter permease [Sedimentimonas flavescens]MBW0158908.1 ABC transporter permease [Sedimentimonas flavescens]MCT2540304.1 ABC transporter permease [Sedimentimonas flavescens]WBL33716.1 ABC transporter permease [Sinirhodobacter sp. HNIBRBA609]
MTLGGIDIIVLTATLMAASTPVLLAATGELIAEKAGVLNLGVEGMMIMGAMAGFAVAVTTGSPVAGFLAGAVAGALMALLFAILTQVLLSNQTATGLALTLFGLGLSALFGKGYEGVRPPSTGKVPFGPLAEIPVIGPVLFSHDWVVYASLILVAVTWAFLRFTRAGLILRAVGESHDAAHALGYRVIAVRVAALAFGGALAGLGGAYLSLVRVPQWTEGMTAGAGWIALAIVVFASWRAERVLIGAYLFGGITALQLQLQAAGYAIPVHLLSMAPYVITIVVLVILSAIHRRGAQAAPADLGRSFHASA